jgi:hypothetical protein
MIRKVAAKKNKETAVVNIILACVGLADLWQNSLPQAIESHEQPSQRRDKGSKHF